MAELQIRPVMSRVEQKRFIRLPWRIYKDDPCWMPPLVMAQEELLGFRRHPFYEASRTQSFLASDQETKIQIWRGDIRCDMNPRLPVIARVSFQSAYLTHSVFSDQ